MTQEEKSLLLKDLCARLPYDTIVSVTDGTIKYKAYIESISYKNIQVSPVSDSNFTAYTFYKISEIKPYLRSMSSMTEEEKEELKEIGSEYLEKWENAQDSIDKWRLDAEVSCKRSEFYNSHLLDWHGLIPKGLAIEAPKDIYDSNSKED